MGISYHLKEMNFLAFLILVSTFDRSLGDIFATISSASQVPFLLRDLLLKPELEKLFGKKIVKFVSHFFLFSLNSKDFFFKLKGNISSNTYWTSNWFKFKKCFVAWISC